VQPDTAFTLGNGHDPRGEGEALLRDLFVGLYLGRLDLRLGQQRLAWGRAEFVNPNDVMNPRDARNPFVNEPELGHLPSPLVRADADLGSGVSLQVAVAPYFVPDLYDVYGTNWAAVQADAPARLRSLTAILGGAVDPSLRSRADRLLAQTSLPAANLSAPVLGAKLAGPLPGIDVAAYYQYGFDGPALNLSPVLEAGPVPQRLGDLAPLLGLIGAATPPIDAPFVRRHHLGLDLVVPLSSLVIRADAAYQSRKIFFRRDFVAWEAPVLQGTVGLEYQSGDPERAVIVEAFGLEVLGERPPGLLFYRRGTLGISALIRWPLRGHLGLDARLSGGIHPQMHVLQPQLIWKANAWQLALGALVLGGEDFSFAAYYRRNSEIYLRLKLGY
jgi:hypothetical protein